MVLDVCKDIVIYYDIFWIYFVDLLCVNLHKI